MRIRILAAAVSAAALVSALGGTAAQAAPAPKIVSVTTAMHIVGFDAAVAKAHGYIIKKDAEGREYSVKADASDLRAQATPETTISGDCGSSTVTFVGIGGYKGKMGTGFVLASDSYAIGFSWTVYFADRFGVSHQSWGDPLNLDRSWATSYTFGTSISETATASVSAGSYALLATGGVCSSGGPSATATIYS